MHTETEGGSWSTRQNPCNRKTRKLTGGKEGSLGPAPHLELEERAEGASQEKTVTTLRPPSFLSKEAAVQGGEMTWQQATELVDRCHSAPLYPLLSYPDVVG